MGRGAPAAWLASACMAVLCVAGARAEQLQVHVIFSQHLDVGFNARTPGLEGTDDAAINVYFDRHFKAAIATADAFRAQNGTRQYRWMAHAWLISLYFDCPPGMGLHCPSDADKQAVADAIRRGDIYWHALPFNGQAEFFDAPLLEYAAFLVHRTDDAFGLPHKRTASLRDVPGITRAAIPILNSRGIAALSQGVNGASAPPGVPHNTLTRWRDPASGGSLLHWVHAGGYSGWPHDTKEECVRTPGLSHVLCHAWKQDNEGPHTLQEATNIFDYYAASFPGACVAASTFDDFLAAAEPTLETLDLPTHSAEIGDTWIYGIPSDAAKVSRYLAALRLRGRMLWRYDDAAFFNFSRLLMKVPEHTWGVDVKSTLNDFTAWDNASFQKKLAGKAPNFEKSVGSWRRQARYIDWALEALGLSPEALEEHLPRPLPNAAEDAAFAEADPDRVFSAGGWRFAIDGSTGGLSALQRQWPDGSLGTPWASAEYPIGQFVYETFLESDFNAGIFDTYIFSPDARAWADFDFGKHGCASARPRRSSGSPAVQRLWAKQAEAGAEVLAQSVLPAWTWAEAGAPQQVLTHVRAEAGGGLGLSLSLRLKTPTRLPEAGWVRFRPPPAAADAGSWLLHKLGQPMSPLEVGKNGSQAQHAVSPEGVSVASPPAADGSRELLTIRCLDAVLVSPGRATPFPVISGKPDMSHGVSWGLLNNIWGTNYPQWQPFDASGVNLTFRFTLTAERLPPPSTAGLQLPAAAA